jgi:hypothetical protein
VLVVVEVFEGEGADEATPAKMDLERVQGRAELIADGASVVDPCRQRHWCHAAGCRGKIGLAPEPVLAVFRGCASRRDADDARCWPVSRDPPLEAPNRMAHR